jgi:hypothetical protein
MVVHFSGKSFLMIEFVDFSIKWLKALKYSRIYKGFLAAILIS